MGIAKWSMRICAVLFVLIGLAALAVALVPSINEWIAENSVESYNANPGGVVADYRPTGGVVEPGDVQTTAWILVAVFLPMAALFWWMGRWFRSMQPAVAGMVQQSMQMMQNTASMYQGYGQGTVVGGQGVPFGTSGPVNAPPPPHVDPNLPPPPV